MKLGIWIFWPSFVVGAVANAMFFSMFDPAELHLYWDFVPSSRIAAYSFGLFAFWVIAACSSAFTCFIQRGAQEVNQRACPIPNDQRPIGCRMREPG